MTRPEPSTPTAAPGAMWAGLLPPVPAPAPDGLDTVITVLAALKDGHPIPPSAATHLAQALRPCLAGDNDIAGRLGLRAPRRGAAHEAPAALARKLRRDYLALAVTSRMGGPASTSALALQILWNYWHLTGATTSTTPSGPLLGELATYPPLSHRQILRIVQGAPAYNKHPKK